MNIYTCPKCGNKMENVAPNFCPNCGCQSADFALTEVNDSEVKESSQTEDVSKEQEKKGCSFAGCIGIGLIVFAVSFVILLLADSVGGNDDSSTNQKIENKEIVAKNYFVKNCIKKNMHDPKSYKEESYDVKYDIINDEYIVTVSFRGNNAFGNPVLSTYKGGVKFTNDNRVQCRIIP